MGGKVKLMITGSAPVSAEVLTFIRAAMGCLVVEGYGQTECVACATVTLEGDHTPGQVGPPAVCAEIRLVDVPEMGYFSREGQGQGEVCIRGPTVFKGYYKDEERTKEVLDDEGWLHTGDIGQWSSSGTLQIVDRKKHIFKLSQVLSKAVAKELGIHGKTFDELCQDPRVKKLILDDMTKVGKNAGLHSFEQVKDVHVSSELWTVENDLLTPTLKTKRPELKKFFEQDIGRMYSSLV